MGYLTLKSRVSFPNGGCGTALFPTVDIRPAVSTCKEPSQLGLLTGDILSQTGQGVSVDSHRSTQSPLPDSCTQFCPNCTWPWVSGRGQSIQTGKDEAGRGTIDAAMGKLLSVSNESFLGGCLRVTRVPTGNPSPNLCKQVRYTQGDLWRNCTLVCC